ncbi:MAG: hypothetical protein ACYDD4_03575 [Acidimicrobiales bacterium]
MPEAPDHEHAAETAAASYDAGPILDVFGGPDEDSGDIIPTDEMIDLAKWFAGDEDQTSE